MAAAVGWLACAAAARAATDPVGDPVAPLARGDASTRSAAPHAAYFEVLGKGGLYGVGYDWAFADRLAVGGLASFMLLDDRGVRAGRILPMSTGRAGRSRGAAVLALIAAACGLHDHPGGDHFVPFAEIQGELAPEMQNPFPPAPPPAGRLRVVTYNVHYGPDVSALAAAFTDAPSLAAADIVFLEEIDAHPAEGATRAARLASAIGMNHAYAPAWAYPDGGTHGLAVLSRFPITTAGVLDLPYFELGMNPERRIALRATLQVGDRSLAIVVLHLDTRLNVNDRLEQLAPAARLADASSMLGGDFNTLPFAWAGRAVPMVPQEAAAPLDVAAAVDEFMGNQGFAAPTAASGDTTNSSLLHAKLDSIYLRGYEGTGSGVERSVGASDHFPVWVDVAWP